MGLFGLDARVYKTYARRGIFCHTVGFVDGKKTVGGRRRRANL
jgi:hypothetical protein